MDSIVNSIEGNTLKDLEKAATQNVSFGIPFVLIETG